MELVALQGLLDSKSLLQLSTTASHTLTRLARHKAMKSQMQKQREERRLIGWERIRNSYDRTLALGALAQIAICNDYEHAQETAVAEIRRASERRVPAEEVRQMGMRHIRFTLEVLEREEREEREELEEEPEEESEQESEEPVEEEGRVFARV